MVNPASAVMVTVWLEEYRPPAGEMTGAFGLIPSLHADTFSVRLGAWGLNASSSACSSVKTPSSTRKFTPA